MMVSVSITDPFCRCYNFLKINDLLQRITSSNRKQNALRFFSGDRRGNALVDRLELRQRARGSFWGAATLSRVPNRPLRRLPLRQTLEKSGVVLLVGFRPHPRGSSADTPAHALIAFGDNMLRSAAPSTLEQSGVVLLV